MRIRNALLIFLFLAGCVHKPPVVSSTSALIILKGVRVIDGNGGPPIENASLVIRQDKIDSILSADAFAPHDATVIDMTGKTVMPALIAAHTHLGLTKGPVAGVSNLNEDNVLRQLRKYMAYGVGTVLSLGTDHDFIYALRDQRLKNEIQTPMILTAGHGFGVPDGGPPESMGMDQVYRPKTTDDVRKEMNELAVHHPDIVKVWVDDFSHTLPKMKSDLYKDVIKEAHRHGFRVAAHVYYLEDAKRLAKDGIDIFAHSIRDKEVDRELIALMKKNKIACIPTLALDEAAFIYADYPAWMNEPFFKKGLDAGIWNWLHSTSYKPKEPSRKDLEIAQKNALTLLNSGVLVGFGTDSGAALARLQGFAEHRELELLVSSGFTPMQALQAATRSNAEMLGLSEQRGTLTPGKKADLLVLNENPLDDIRNTHTINSVWLEGRQVSTDFKDQK